MKRIILMLILLFPVVTLALWVYWGSTRPKPALTQPATTTNAPSQTNFQTLPRTN